MIPINLVCMATKDSRFWSVNNPLDLLVISIASSEGGGAASRGDSRMRIHRLLVVGALLAAISVTVSTQTSVTGRWRALLLLPEGNQAEIGFDLKADGASVTGTITGPPVTIREGRIEGNTITLNLNNANGRPTTFTGQISGNDILFEAVGLAPQPLHFVAVRDLRSAGAATGSLTDA